MFRTIKLKFPYDPSLLETGRQFMEYKAKKASGNIELLKYNEYLFLPSTSQALRFNEPRPAGMVENSSNLQPFGAGS